MPDSRQYTRPTLDLAAPAATLPGSTPSGRSWSAPLPAQDERDIAKGKRERRLLREAQHEAQRTRNEARREGVVR